MGYKITNAKFLNPTIDIHEFNFDSEKNTISQVLIKNQQEKKLLTKAFKGKEQVVEGRFLIDGLDLVNPKFVKSKSKFIYTDKYFERFVPARMYLIFSNLIDPKFIRNARINHLRTKSDYLNYKSSNNNQTSIELKNSLDSIISKFIDEEIKTENRVLDEFRKQLDEYNSKKSKAVFEKSDNISQIVAKNYQKEKVQLETYNLNLTFYQSLWDDIYTFNDLRNSCTCEYNARHSSNKAVRKMTGELNYSQTKYVVSKQLKYINIRITEMRSLIRKQTRLVKQLKIQLNFELEKMYIRDMYSKDKKIALQKEITKWNKVISDQLDVFTKNQQNYFFKTLSNTSQYIAKMMVVSIHQYHQLVLANKLKYGDPSQYKKIKKEYKNKIVSIYKQAYDFNANQMRDLDITMEWFLKSTFKVSSLNILFIKILGAINSNKNNIFLMDFVHLLTDSDFQKLIKTLNEIKKRKPEISFIIVDSKMNKMPDLSQQTYMFEDKDFKNYMLVNAIDKSPEFFRTNMFNNKNLFNYIYQNNHISVLDKSFGYDNHEIKPKGEVFINPLKMQYQMDELNPLSDTVYMHSVIKRPTSFNDKNMYYCRNDKGDKFYFYTKRIVNLKKNSRGYVSFNLNDIAEFI